MLDFWVDFSVPFFFSCCLLGICSFAFFLALWQGFFFLGLPSGQIRFSLGCFHARSFPLRSVCVRVCFHSLAFTLVRFCFARSFFVRSLSRWFLSVSLALRSFVFRSVAFTVARFCFGRFALALLALVSFRSNPPTSLYPLSCAFRCLFICLSVSFFSAITPALVCDPFAQRANPPFLFVTPSRISLRVFFLLWRLGQGALLLEHSNAPSVVVKEVKKAHAKAFFLSAFSAISPTPLCAPFLVHLDVYLYVCLFLSSAR